MITKAVLINQPYSGEFKERIYDFENPWNSQNWTFVKFTNDDNFEWCGEFRGSPIEVQISKKYKSILVLTSDYLFHLDFETGNIISYEDQPQYKNLIISPDDSFIIADYMNIEKITDNIKQKIELKSPIEMDFIEFKGWNQNKLEFTCEEFIYWDKVYMMTYDNITNLIEIKNVS